MDALQKELEQIDQAMQTVLDDYDALNTYSMQRQELEEKLEEKTIRWMELEEKMEQNL